MRAASFSRGAGSSTDMMIARSCAKRGPLIGGHVDRLPGAVVDTESMRRDRVDSTNLNNSNHAVAP